MVVAGGVDRGVEAGYPAGDIVLKREGQVFSLVDITEGLGRGRGEVDAVRGRGGGDFGGVGCARAVVGYLVID